MLSTDFGLKEFNIKNKKKRVRRYRRYVYEAGALNRLGNMIAKKSRVRQVQKQKPDHASPIKPALLLTIKPTSAD